MTVFPDLRRRQRQPEWIDDPAADPAELRRSLAYIRRINALLGYTRATIHHLEHFSRRWRPGETIRILDVATGSADIPRAILKWSRRSGFDVRIVAVDLHHTTLRLAADEPLAPTPSPGTQGEAIGSSDRPRAGGGVDCFAKNAEEDPHPNPPPEYREKGRGIHDTRPSPLPQYRRRGQAGRLQFVRANALHLPFADASFDYAHTAMFLHHLDDADAAAVLREMARVSRRGIIAADLLRNRRAYAWITLFTLMARPMVRHDARVSVAQAYTRDEVLALRDRAGVGFAEYHRHFGHRFVLAGER